MNFVDIGILLILAICILGGYYRGFVSTVLGLCATLFSFLVGRLCIPLIANAVRGHDSLYSMMLYYTEGAEYVAATDVELTRVPISQISREQLKAILQKADMPLPMDNAVTKNIATEAFSAEGITTLGDYFNQTIVCVVINIVALLLVFLLVRLVLGFFIQGIDYARGGYPVLWQADGPIGAGVGLLHGVLLLFVIFLLLPIGLVILPKLYEFVSESFFGEFFYRANFFLRMIPSV